MNESLELHKIVPEYHSRNPLVRWLFLKRLDIAIKLARFQKDRGLSILDLGCGEGLLLRRLKASYPQFGLTGMDHNPNIALLNIPGVDLHQCDFTQEGSLPVEVFDCIFCLDVLEHIQDLNKPLKSIHNALKPGGLLIVSAPTENAFHKACRFLLKGTFSEQEGPASSPHYHRAATLRDDIVAVGFQLLKQASLPLPGIFALNQTFSFKKVVPEST